MTIDQANLPMTDRATLCALADAINATPIPVPGARDQLLAVIDTAQSLEGRISTVEALVLELVARGNPTPDEAALADLIASNPRREVPADGD